MTLTSKGLAAVMLILSAELIAAQPIDTASNDERFHVALVAYESSRWQQAYAAFSALAEAGHPEGARIAALMWRLGASLYRTTFDAQPRQLERWFSLAAGQATLPQQPSPSDAKSP